MNTLEQQYISHSNTGVGWDFYYSFFTSDWEMSCVSRLNHDVVHSVIHNSFMVYCCNSRPFITIHSVINKKSQCISQINNALDVDYNVIPARILVVIHACLV